MKKKLASLVLFVCLAVPVMAGEVPTGGITKCPPDTVCLQSAPPEEEESAWVDFLTFILSLF